jgi:nucleotide-binding universal stress UspA family protein
LPPSNSTVLRDITPILKQDAETQLLRLANQIKANPEYTNVAYTTVAKKGQLVTELRTVAKEMHADLIVMGTKGATGISEIFIGTNTASVIEATMCPVMAIPEKAVYKNINRILYATDYNTIDFDSVRKLAEIAGLFNASIVLLHVASDAFTTIDEAGMIEAFAQKIKQEIAYPDISYRLVESSDILNSLNSTIQSMNIDLVAMTTRKRNFFEKYFSNSMTKKMAYHTSIPLLAFHT